jgi:hypothetical protein
MALLQKPRGRLRLKRCNRHGDELDEVVGQEVRAESDPNFPAYLPLF